MNTSCSVSCSRRLAMSCFIGQSLADEALERNFGTLYVIDPELRASVHTEIEFGQIPMKMFLVHVLIDPDQPALEDAEIALKRVGVNIATHPFILRVIDRFMLSRSRHDELVGSRSVSDQAAMDVAMIQVYGA